MAIKLWHEKCRRLYEVNWDTSCNLHTLKLNLTLINLKIPIASATSTNSIQRVVSWFS